MNKKIKTIGLVAPCGNIRDFCDIDKKIESLEQKFIVKKFYNTVSYNYLSDTDENRAKYLQDAFLDKEVDLVLNIRGGYGALRIIDIIDYDLIKNVDKYYASSSDGSILLAYLSKYTKIKCFHSLMITNGFVENMDKNISIIENDTFDINLKKIYSINSGSKGYLWGGNLSSIVSMFSNDSYLPKNDIILFLEDLNEPLYKLDKMLCEIYRNKPLKNKIKGIIFGDFYLEENEINPLIEEYSKKFNTNCYKTQDITHKPNNITIPYNKLITIA